MYGIHLKKPQIKTFQTPFIGQFYHILNWPFDGKPTSQSEYCILVRYFILSGINDCNILLCYIIFICPLLIFQGTGKLSKSCTFENNHVVYIPQCILWPCSSFCFQYHSHRKFRIFGGVLPLPLSAPRRVIMDKWSLCGKSIILQHCVHYPVLHVTLPTRHVWTHRQVGITCLNHSGS